MVAEATVHSIKRRVVLGSVGGLAAGIGAETIGYQAIDKVSGMALPFLPGAEQLLQPTSHVGQIAAEQKYQLEQDDFVQRMD